MNYIENIYICLAAPLFIAAFCVRRQGRTMLLFVVSGMTACLLSSYISTFLAAASGADMLTASLTLATVVEEIMKIIEADPYANVTFSGGDPMYQAAGFAELAREIHKRTNKDIWCYTGFTFESLITQEQRELLEQLDVLVDGPFIEKLRDTDLLFRGSSNQRLIDVQASLYSGKIVLWHPDIAVAICQKESRLRDFFRLFS